jgi:hypothetical protein
MLRRRLWRIIIAVSRQSEKAALSTSAANAGVCSWWAKRRGGGIDAAIYRRREAILYGKGSARRGGERVRRALA